MTMNHTADHPATSTFMTNHLVANLGMLNVKIHQYHWHIQGPHFFTLHAKFKKLYNEANQYFDMFAERLISIGEKPYSTLEEFLEHSFIQEKVYDEKITAEKMVGDLVGNYRTIRDVTVKGIQLANKEKDNVTGDMLRSYKEKVDANIWMLQAHLGKDAYEGEEE